MASTYKLIVVLSLATMLCWSCKSESGQKADEAPKEVVTTPSYPPLGNEAISKLYADADQVDIIFFYLPISVNQEDPASVKSTVLYVSPAAPQITGQCKAIARLSWIAEGAIIKEADVFLDTGCIYLLFMEDNKPAAANAMSPAGVEFFNNIISQVEKKRG